MRSILALTLIVALASAPASSQQTSDPKKSGAAQPQPNPATRRPAPATPAPRPSPAPRPAISSSASPDQQWQAHIDEAQAAYDAADGPRIDAAAAAALTHAERRFPANIARIARSLVYVGIGHLAGSRHAQAEPPLRRALALYDANGGRDRMEAVAAMTYLAEARMSQGDLVEAERLLTESFAIARARGGDGHVDTVRTALTLGFLLSPARFAEAEAVMIPIHRAARTALGPGQRQVLQLGSAIGALRYNQGRWTDAEAEFRRTLADADTALGPDHPTSASIAANLGQVLMDSGRARDADPIVRRAVASAERSLGRDHGETLGYVVQLSRLLADRGEFAESERLAQRVVETTERLYSEDHPALVQGLEALVITYLYQGRNGEALPLQQRALAARQRGQGDQALGTNAAEMLLADIYSAMGDAVNAEPINRRVLAGRIALLGDDHPLTIVARIKLGAALSRLERPDDVIALLEPVIGQSTRAYGAEHEWTLGARGTIAYAYWSKGRHSDAEPIYAQLMQTAINRFGERHPQTIGYATSLAHIRLQMEERAGDAIFPASLVANAILNQRQGSDSIGQRQAARAQSLAAPSLTLYADAQWAAEQVNPGANARRVTDAFEALQNASSGGAARAVLRTAARRVADASNPRLGPIVREREALEDASTTNAADISAALALTGAEGDTRRAALRAERSRIETALSRIDTDLRASFPDYFSLIRPEAVSAQATQAMLADDEAILMVVPTDYGTHVMALSRTDGRWIRNVATADQVDESVRRLLWDVGGSVAVSPAEAARWQEEGGRGYPFARTIAYNLYSQIVWPMRTVLAGKRHVFVVTTGSLTSLPFGMLVTEAPTGADGDPAALRNTRWLADAHALIQIPTIQSLYLQRRAAAANRTRSAGSSFIGFGDPLLDGAAVVRAGGRGAARGAGGSGAILADTRELKRMARLPGTAIELQNMRAALSAPASSVRLGAAATERAVRTADLSGARIVALATHGLMAGEIDGASEPGLVFTPPAAASVADDGLLTASEIAELRLDAEWVILSACNTAAGDGSAGAPGLSGLAQAFFFAGAQTLLASHWPVRDDVAAQITVRTIEIQRDTPGLSRAEAFQRAMREIRNDSSHDSAIDSWAHPNAWAAFTLIGDGAR